MHYIRLLRRVQVASTIDSSFHFCKVLLTITTDLGDDFYAPLEPLPLTFVIDHARGRTKAEVVTGEDCWTAGKRVLSIQLRVPVNNLFQGPATLRIFATSQPVPPLENDPGVQTNSIWSHGLREPRAELIVPCHYKLQKDSPQNHSFRSLPLHVGEDLTFEEELGESIARHLWDAGVITATFLSDVCTDKEAISSVFPIASDKTHINVLELGCGIGVLGITLAAVLEQIAKTQECKDPKIDVLLTDVDDAEDRASSNIAAAAERLRRDGDQSTVQLAYENLDWDDGRHGKFGPLASQRFDYVVLSDCTYNVDSFPALVGTLSAVHAQNCRLLQSDFQTRVLLATKPRHSSEESLFGILDQEDWQHSVTKSIPVIRDNAEDDAVHIYMLRKGTAPTQTPGQVPTPKRCRTPAPTPDPEQALIPALETAIISAPESAPEPAPTPAPALSSPTKRKTPDRITEGATTEGKQGMDVSPSKKRRT